MDFMVMAFKRAFIERFAIETAGGYMPVSKGE